MTKFSMFKTFKYLDFNSNFKFQILNSFLEDRNVALLLLILLGTFVLRVPSLYEPFWYRDEGIYFFVANGLNHGLGLYKDLFEISFPAKYLLLAASLKIFGQSIWSARFLLSYWILATQVSLFFLGKKLFNAKTGLLASLIYGLLTALPVLEGNIFNTELLWAFPTTLGFILFLHKKPVFSGLFFGLAFLFKLHALFDFFALLLFIVWKDSLTAPKKLVSGLRSYLLGFSLPFLFTFLYFWGSSNIAPFIEATLTRNISYGQSYNKLFFPYDLLILKFLVLATVIFLIRGKIKAFFKNNSELNLIIFWLLFSIFSATLSGRSYIHYLLQGLGAFSLLVSFALIKKKAVRFLVIFLVGIFSLMFNAPLLSYYQNFFAYLKGNLSQIDYNNSFDRKVNRNYDLAALVKQKTDPTDKIFIWADEPTIYPLSGRLGATRFSAAYHILESPKYQEEVIEKLKQESPKLILWEKDYPFALAQLANLIQAKYTLVGVVENVNIFKII